jgi:Secretin and TonB N terminus short domain
MQRGVWARARAESVWVAVVLLPALIPTGAFCAGESFGSSRQLELKIAPAPLRDALTQLADLADLQILYDPPLVEGWVSRGLEGRMSPRQALEKLLAATDISFEFTADDAVALHPKPKTTLPTAGRWERHASVCN